MADNRPSPMKVGVGVALGAGVGSAMFAATSSPVWIGVGVAIGAALGAAADQIEQEGSEGDIDS